jgi:DNA-binding SARP family transcriptional activator
MREMEPFHPFIRIHLFGEFIVERLISSPTSKAPQYERVRREAWRSRGPAIAVLKVLLCRPRRRATKDELIEAVWSSEENDEREHAFDSAISIVRTILRTPHGESLLTKVRHGGVTIYALPNQQQIWVDADAFEQLIAQALQAERREENTLPLWEAAQELVTGEFLEDDPYRSWAQARRHILNAARHRCVHRLADLYLARNMPDQAERLLQEVVIEDLTDEDALCHLMALLEQQGRNQEAWRLYQQTVRVLDEEYRLKPSPRTHELADRIHNGSVSATNTSVSAVIHLLPTFPMAVPSLQASSSSLARLQDAFTFSTEQLESTWLAFGVSGLAQLLEAGWSFDTLCEVLPVLLSSFQVMPICSRRTFLHMSVATLLNGIPLPIGKHIAGEERTQLARVFGQNIAASWHLFHTTSNGHILAVGQAQLSLLEQVSAYLYPGIRPLFYSGVYRLIGASFHFQGAYREALHAQEKAYVAALELADVWNMAQSRSWQAYTWQARGRYHDALQATEAALHLLVDRDDLEHLRLKARLLALGAELASLVGDETTAQVKLEASEALLPYFSASHEEFDRASWLQAAGTCAFHGGHYSRAIQHLQQAIDALPSQWVRRYLSTALPLGRAFAHLQEREASLAVAQQMLPLLKTVQAQTFTQAFADYLREDLLANFPHDSSCQMFIADATQQLALASL